MEVLEREFRIAPPQRGVGLLARLRETIEGELGERELPIRFAVTGQTSDGLSCELGVVTDSPDAVDTLPGSVFEFHRRALEDLEAFNVAMIIPTGIGAEIGGHSGDAGAVARLLAAQCDTLIQVLRLVRRGEGVHT